MIILFFYLFYFFFFINSKKKKDGHHRVEVEYISLNDLYDFIINDKRPYHTGIF
jgi:hypothetical protein